MIQNMPHPSPSQCPRPPIFMRATFYDGSRELQGRQLSRGSRGSSSTKNIGTRHQSAFPNVSLFFFSSLSSFPFSSFLLFPSPFFLSFSSFFLFPFSPFLLFSCSSSLLFSFSSVTLFLFSSFPFFFFHLFLNDVGSPTSIWREMVPLENYITFWGNVDYVHPFGTSFPSNLETTQNTIHSIVVHSLDWLQSTLVDGCI